MSTGRERTSVFRVVTTPYAAGISRGSFNRNNTTGLSTLEFNFTGQNRGVQILAVSFGVSVQDNTPTGDIITIRKALSTLRFFNPQGENINLGTGSTTINDPSGIIQEAASSDELIISDREQLLYVNLTNVAQVRVDEFAFELDVATPAIGYQALLYWQFLIDELWFQEQALPRF